MRLTWKLTIALAAGILVMLAVNAVVRLGRETKLFHDDIARDDATMGRTIAGAVERTWQTAGAAAALDLVANANERESDVQIRWIWPDAVADDEHAPILPGPARAAIASHQASTTEGRVAGDDDAALITYVPVTVTDGRRGAIELRESLKEERSYIRATVIDLTLVTIGLVAICVLLALGLGVVFVGRPMGKLVEQARRIGRGDFTNRLEVRQRDEIGELAREMNSMSDRLGDAMTRIDAESQARLAAIEQLRHADRLLTVGKLAAGIAHELGTPLNVITGYAQLVMDDQPEGAPTRVHAGLIAAQAQRMAGIIGQLLDFARPRSPVRDVQEVAPVVAQTLTLLEAIARTREVECRFDATTAASGATASFDAGQVQQALTNILVNAIQASPPGGTVAITVAREARAAPADLGGGHGAFVAIRVADEGPGMTDEIRARLFEPFFTTKPVGEGTGLGLPVTYGIVREHGGWIEVDSAPGRGSTFTIYLPADASAEAAA
jgi:signal transduction histidine kinase